MVVLAGDGTLNEAADGLVGTDTALAPLPCGSTNVYARTIGVATNNVAEYRGLLAALEWAKAHEVHALTVRSDSLPTNASPPTAIGLPASSTCGTRAMYAAPPPLLNQP